MKNEVTAQANKLNCYYITTGKQAMGTGWKRSYAPVLQPVPANRDQWPRPRTPGFSPGALGIHWYQLERPTSTKETAMLT